MFFFSAADGTTRVISGPTSILPKTPQQQGQTPNQQSLIKVTGQGKKSTIEFKKLYRLKTKFRLIKKNLI